MTVETELFIAAVAAVIGGAALTIVGFLQRAGRLPRNWFVGIRTRRTLVGDDAWDAAHEAPPQLVLVAGTLMIVGGVASLMSSTETSATVVLLAGLMLGAAVLVVAGVRGHRAATRSTPRPSGHRALDEP